MTLDDLQLWMLIVIGATFVVMFVVVAIVSLLSVVGILKLPADVAGRLHTVLVVEVAVVAIGAVAFLLSPNQIEDLKRRTTQIAAPSSTASEDGTEVELPPDQADVDLDGLACASGDITPLLYIHFGTEEQRALAREAQELATSLGLYAPGIELRRDYTSDETQLRYFHQEETEDAAMVLRALDTRLTLPNPTLRRLRLDARACQFELWIGAPS